MDSREGSERLRKLPKSASLTSHASTSISMFSGFMLRAIRRMNDDRVSLRSEPVRSRAEAEEGSGALAVYHVLAVAVGDRRGELIEEFLWHARAKPCAAGLRWAPCRACTKNASTLEVTVVRTAIRASGSPLGWLFLMKVLMSISIHSRIHHIRFFVSTTSSHLRIIRPKWELCLRST
jgi:hypothetical protein